MSIPTSAVGLKLSHIRTTVERGRLLFFGEATGSTDPLFLDLETARQHGYPDLPVPPTFLFGLKLDGPEPLRWLAALGVDLRHILHGSQSFSYHSMAFAGDALEFLPQIVEVYEKKNGALEFVVVETTVKRGGDVIATLRETIVVRHPQEVAA